MLRGIILLSLVLLLAPLSSAQQTCTALPSKTEIRLTGFTRARAVLDIISEVSGRCLNVTVDVGERIGKDGIFARIDPTFIKLDLDANSIARKQVQRQLRFDEQEVARYKKLVAGKSSARSRLDELELRLDLSKLKLAGLATEAQRLEETLIRHAIHVPTDWQIISRSVEPGEWITAGTPLAKAGDYRTLIVPVALSPEELHSLQFTPTVPLILPGDRQTGSGCIYRISPEFDPATRKIKVDIALSPKTLAALPRKQGGLRVEIPLTLPDPMQAFMVPANAVVERYEENWLTRENGDKLRVIVLGPAPGSDKDDRPWLRITSPEITEGDIFLLTPGP